jgi:ABC-2 type transport system permease protein
MTPWRLEWLRLVRTPRGISLAAVYLLFGLLGPVTARYMADIVERVQSGVTIIVPPPTPKDGISQYVSQVSQTGLIVVVVVAAGALAFDSRRGISTFLRTRAANLWALVLPRYVVTALAAVGAYTLGTLGAWYETALLIGSLPVTAMLAGLVCQAVFLAFAVAVVALAASLARSTLGTIGIALGLLLVLPIAGIAGVLHDWLPTTLVNAPVDLLTITRPSDYLPTLAVTAAVTPAVLFAAVARLRRREV